MAEKRIKKRLVWEDSGVSEIIGTILMLSITVVMFSSIITFVGRMPAPQENFSVDVDCSIEPLNPNDWNQGVNFTILHQGGKALDPMWIQIFITVNDTMLKKNIGDGLIDQNGDGWLGVGEKWVYTIYNTEAPVWQDSTYSITIIHQEKNLLIWQETLGKGSNFYAPVIVDMWIDSDLGTPQVDDPGPISYIDGFKIYARILDPEGVGGAQGLDTGNLWVNLSSIYGTLAPPVQLVDWVDSRDALNDDIYVAVCPAPSKDDAAIGYHYFTFNATDNAGLTVQRVKLFPVGMIVGDNPQIVVQGNNPQTGDYEYIWFSNPEPINGDSITIYATIRNLGGSGADLNVTFYDGKVNPANVIGVDNPSLAAQGERDARTTWTATPGGNHTIIVVAELNGSSSKNKGLFDPVPEDNSNQTNLSVMPKILLVDDDGHLNDRSAGDTVSYMRASLEAADFNYDFVAVGAGDGPGYDYGDHPLQDYDVVIWMAGYETGNVLTDGTGPMSSRTDDVANLQKFLEGNSTGGNGGSLWFISQGFWDEALTDPALTTFASSYLHIPTMPPTMKNNLPTDLYGNKTHPVTDYYAANPINTVLRVGGTDNVWSWGYTEIPDKTMIALNDSANTRVYALSYDSDDYASDPVTDSRILTQTWDFSRIEDTATQAQYTYKAIKWLGNITMKYTRDVAISEQTIEPATVFYKQNVTISFVVRNNGFREYNYSNGDDLWYLLRITDMTGNDLVPPHLERIYYLGAGSNNTLTISYSWIPEQIGYHRVVIKVDPYNYIAESNELNNEISSYLASGELFVQYRILVVDDDGSVNNYGTNVNETMEITNSLNYLNSTGNYQFENYTVNLTDNGPAFDPALDGIGLSEYNAVIWVGGEAINPLTSWDIANITNYMDLGGNFWFIGNGLWTAADEVVDVSFEQQYLKIAAVSGDRNMASTIWGVENDYVSHGMEYPNSGDPNADILTPFTGGIGFTCQNDAKSLFNSVRFQGNAPGNFTRTYRTATTAWLMSSLNDDMARNEFTFMMLRWFEKPESRIETRITNMDIWLSDEHPQLGSGYVIQATGSNTGGALGNVLVRFMDGNTQIGSDSISVSPGETTTAEMIWVPLFAGQRTIHVLVDPIGEVPEIFDWFNNNATRSVYVYFFWDDMESGASKWAHSSTILLINGEEPLEYFYDTTLDTNIITNWDDAMSQDLTTCTDTGFYHTLDTAFWLQEPAGSVVTSTRLPVDVVFALDTSGSMSNADIQNMRDATKNFIAQLTDTDRAAIFTFDGGGWEVAQPMLLEPYAYMTAANKIAFNASIDNPAFDTGGYTPFYDTVGEAIQYTQSNLLPGRLEFVVGMTDGVSNSDDTYTPNANWGQIVAGDTAYSQQAPHPTQGILYPPCMVYTIGLGITHDPLYPTAPDWSHINPPREASGYGLEYDLWNTADSTPNPLNDAGGKYGENATTGEDNRGHYFYTTDSAQLPGIFQIIFSSISQTQLVGENQTRSTPAPPSPKATLWSDGFESGDFSAWTSVGAEGQDWDVITTTDFDGRLREPHSGTYSATCRDSNGNNDYLRKDGLDLTGYANVQLSFWYHYEDLETSEALALDVYHDGAWETNVWTLLGTNNGDRSTTQPEYIQVTVDISALLATPDQIINIRFEANSNWDWLNDECALDDVLLTGDPAIVAPWIVSTSPYNTEFDVLTNQGIVITFSEQINPITFAWNIVPDPSPGSWTETWSAGDTVVTLTHPVNYAQSTGYTVTVTAAEDMDGNTLLAGGIFSDGFEIDQGWTGYGGTGEWERGAPSGLGGNDGASSPPGSPDPSSANSGSMVIGNDLSGSGSFPGNYENNIGTTSWLMSPSIDCTGHGTVEMSFYRWLNVEGATYDHATIQVSNDGTTWANVWQESGNPFMDSAWTKVSYDISATAANQATVYVRFGIDSDGGWTYSGWNIDDFQVYDPTTGGQGAPNPWTFTTTGPPTITNTVPFDTETNVVVNQNVVITFSKPMNTGSLLYTCSPDPGGWGVTWSGGDTVATLTHSNFVPSTGYTFTVTQARDTLNNDLVAGAVPNPWTFTTAADNPPTIVTTVPADGVIGVAVTQDIVITFSEPMNIGTVTFTVSPNPGGLPTSPAPAASWSGGDTILTLTHNNFAQGTSYTVQVTAGLDTTGNSLAAGAVPNPWSFLTFDSTPPEILLTTPSDASTGVGLGQPVVVRFTEAMNQATAEAAFSCNPDPGGWTFTWNTLGTEMTAAHYAFNQITTYTCTVSSAAEDLSGNNLAAGAVPNPWTFTTGTSGGGGGAGSGGISPDGPNSNKTAVTETMNLENLASAKLSFWHKYNMMPGANGGFLQVGYNDSGTWKWRYIIPANAYTGNLRASVLVNDSFGTRIFWCWNGISGRGTFDWEYVGVDILNYVPTAYRNQVKVKFNYTQYGGGTGYGWYFDDVRVVVSRSNAMAPISTSQDVWNLENISATYGWNAHSGYHAWSNIDPSDSTKLKAGIDNYLMTTPIDLTNARNANLSAYLKFNINEDSGAPPDGFRVEVSSDNGVTWTAINLGVRSSWGVSGTGADADDGNPLDGKAYTGIGDSGPGNYLADNYWVEMGTLSRVNIDLSSFSGHAIQIRFRMVTCAHPAYEHNNNLNQADPGFGGFFVDDVRVYGETILT